jgi:diguanylate cyclase (GGDEF)-like protein
MNLEVQKALAIEPEPAGDGARYSLRQSLFALVALCVLPAILIATILVVQDYLLQKERVYGQAVVLARQLASGLDQEMAGVESGLRVLATSPDLVQGDLENFQTRATDALKFQIVDNYVLLDRESRQRMNTLLPYGTALPTQGAPSEIAQIFTTGQPVTTGLFLGTATHKPVVAIGVPVFRGGEVIYSLNGTLSPSRLAAAFQLQKLPPGWIAAILDARGTILARSRDADRFVGQQGAPELVRLSASESEGVLEATSSEGVTMFTAFSRSSVAGWRIVVGAPAAALRLQLYRSVGWLILATALAFAVGIWWALRVAGWVSGSIRSLVEPALALGTGQPIRISGSRLAEADAVARALFQAAQMLRRAEHLAHHDSLTGLCNRVLFDELATHQVAIARRTGTSVAVLAIDLDGFKEVNDAHGHATGDSVLRIAAQRILGSIRASDVAARLGGDEFAVLLAAASVEQAWVVAQSLVGVLAEGYPGVTASVSASVGIAVFPQSGVNAAELMVQADAALYEAKRQGKRRAVLDPRNAVADTG